MPASSRRRGCTGIAATTSLPRVTSCGPPSQCSPLAPLASGATKTQEHAVHEPLISRAMLEDVPVAGLSFSDQKLASPVFTSETLGYSREVQSDVGSARIRGQSE